MIPGPSATRSMKCSAAVALDQRSHHGEVLVDSPQFRRNLSVIRSLEEGHHRRLVYGSTGDQIRSGANQGEADDGPV